MAKKTTKAPAKKKPVTMAERVKRIELDVNRHGASLDAGVRQLHDLVAVIAAQLGRIEPQVDKVEREVSLIRSGASFMQELETAKELGPQQVEPEVWKPKVGQYVKPSARAQEDWVLGELRSGVIERVSEGKLWVRELDEKTWQGVFQWRYEPATPEEVAKYHADKEAEEAAKPITPFTTRVKTTGSEEWLVIHGPSPSGNYTLQREVDGYCDTLMAERHEFTVI